MKKLNITKKQYDESKYFTKKYGAIKFVSESGKHYKTDKGVVLALESEMKKEDGDDSIIDRLTDDKEDKGGENEGDVTRGELTDILKDVVAEVEKVCDSQDISFEEVVGVEQPEGESDAEADKDEVVATKDEVAEVLAGVIDTVEQVADKNDIELPEEDDDDDDKSDDDKSRARELDITDEGCDCGKKDCPECNPDQRPATEGCKGGECCPTCGAPMKKECGDKVMESRKARRAKLVREAIARRAKARKLRESRERRMKVRKVLESIRRRRAMKKVMESRKARARKVMESRKLRARRAGMAK